MRFGMRSCGRMAGNSWRTYYEGASGDLVPITGAILEIACGDSRIWLLLHEFEESDLESSRTSAINSS